MTDVKYDYDWVLDAKAQREADPIEDTPKGIAAKPAEQDAPDEKNFLEKMYDRLVGGFTDEEEAIDAMSSKKPSREAVQSSVLDEMEELARQSAEEAALYRMEQGITESLSPYAPRRSLRPPSGTEETTDAPQAIEEATPVTVEELDAEPTGGLMSRRLDGKDGNLEESYNELEMDAFLDEFIPEMAALEGMGGDEVLADLEPTYSYGITEEKANEYGMQPEDYDTMEGFARAFAARYRKEKEEMYPDVFTSDLDKDVERGLQSYLWNRGSFYPGQLRELADGNLNGFIDELKDVVNAGDRSAPNNQSRPMSGLSKRRAAEANLVGRGIEDYVPIATVETTGTQERPIFIWKDAQGNEVNRFASNRPLHSMSTMGEIRVME